MALEDIQLDIVVTLQGSQAIKNATTGLSGLSRAANQVRERSQALQPISLKEAKTWDGLTEALGRVERKYDAVFRAGAHMSMMGHGLIDSAERIAGTLVGVVDKYEDYDIMLRRGAVALNTNVEWQEKLDQAIQKTARANGLLKPAEIAEGYYIWGAAAGMVVDTQEELASVTKVVEATMIATAMAGGTLESNLNGVYAVMSQFQLPMERATDVVEGLTLMTERTAAQFSDLTSAFTFIGPYANELGVQFEDITSMLGLLADAGTKGSRAGRGLQMMLEGLAAPSGPAKEALTSVAEAAYGAGTAFEDLAFDADGKFVGMRKFVMDMAIGLRTMTQEERSYVYAKGFTNNATRAFIPLIREQVKLLEEATGTTGEYTSALDSQKYSLEGAGHFFETMKEQALGSITAIKGRLEGSFFPVLQLLAKTIMEMALPTIELIGDLAVQFGDWLKANPELVKMAVRITGITVAAMAAAGVLFAFGGAVLYMIGNLGVFFQGIGRVLAPFGILIALLVAFGVAVWNNVGGIQDAIKNFASAVGDLFSAVIGDGTELRAAWTGVWSVMRAVAEGAITFIAGVLNTLADAIRALSQDSGFVAFLREAVSVFSQWRAGIGVFLGLGAAVWAAGRAFTFLWGVIKIVTGWSILMAILQKVGVALLIVNSGVARLAILLNAGWLLNAAAAVTKLGMAFGAIRAAFMAGGIAQGLMAVIALLGGPLTLAIGAIIAVVGFLFLAWQNNWFGIREIVAGVVNWFTAVLVPTIVGIVTTVADAAAAIWTLFSDMSTNVGTATGDMIAFIGAVPGAVADFVVGVYASVVEFVNSVPGTLVNAFVWIKDNIGRILGLILGNILGFFLFLVIRAVRFGIEFVTGIIDWIAKLPGRIADLFSQVWTNISTWFGRAIPAVTTWAGQVVTGIVNWFAKLPGNIGEWLSSTWSALSTWFGGLIPAAGRWAKDVIDNVVNFFKDLPQRVRTSVGSLAQKLRDFFNDLPGRIWNSITNLGRDIVSGIWEGVTGLVGWFTRQVRDFVKGIIDGVAGWLGIASPSKVFAEFGSFMVKGLAVGITRDGSALKALRNYSDSLVGVAAGTSLGFSASLDGFGEGGLSVTSDAQRVVRIEMDLTSSDGSYNDATLEQLKAALTGSDLVRALERMAGAE